MMEINSKTYGVLNLKEDQIYSFEAGLLGILDIKQYALFPMEGTSFFVLHGLDEDVSFLLLPAQLAIVDYGFRITDEIIELLSLETSEDVGVMLVVNIQGEDLFVNLMAPILLSPHSLKGCQYIIKDQELPIRYPLSHKEDD
ncbi:flagellar assembly protein FliW [Paenibacillus sp. FSL H7-0714]|uniref:flagellar assembly protein FliW n=1 Tax=Paenibacillus sp. FSL H7-0714 TaxID=2954735 RepID=UPI0030FABB36